MNMVQIPYSLIDNMQLDIYERALLPLLIRHTISWADRKLGIDALFLSEKLQLDIKHTIDILDSLVAKGILEILHVKEDGVKVLLYSLSKKVIDNTQSNIVETVPIDTPLLNKSRYFLDLSRDEYTALQTYAYELLAQAGMNQELFVDFELYQRSKNSTSYDFAAEFHRWMRKEQKRGTSQQLVRHDENFKPTPEQFQLAQYLITFLQKIDPQFIEPTDWSWAQEMKYLIEIKNLYIRRY